jgi:hypothetical protein
MSTVAPARPRRRGRTAREAPGTPEVSVTTERGFTVLRLNAADLPDVAVVDLGDGVNELLCIGARDIEHGRGGNVDFFTEGFYIHQAVEAIAALQFLRAQKGTTDVD